LKGIKRWVVRVGEEGKEEKEKRLGRRGKGGTHLFL
jgi:hypothetical protein